MYRLYWSEGTGAFIPLALLFKVGAKLELIHVDTQAKAHHAPDYLRLNPMGQVPTLILPDGTVLTETAAMLLHIVDAYPQVGLGPAPGTAERAWFDRWLVFLAIAYDANLRVYYPERYTTDPQGSAAVKAAAEAAVTRMFDAFEEHALQPGPFVQGEACTAVDAYAAMLAFWNPPAPDRPKLKRLIEATLAEPAYAAAWQRCLVTTG